MIDRRLFDGSHDPRILSVTSTNDLDGESISPSLATLEEVARRAQAILEL